MTQTHSVEELAAICRTTRRQIVEMITAAKSGHPGGSLSAVEIVVTLYFDVMRHDPANPKWPDRDRFILSKGHAAPVLYSVMAECGLYAEADQLKTLRKLGSIYQGHPDVRFIPALEASTGSLGEGLSLGLGMGGGASWTSGPARTYVMLGDGEIQEGQIWEAAMFGAFHKVDNVVRSSTTTDPARRVREGHHGSGAAGGEMARFGWHTLEVDGHDIPALQGAFAEAAATKGKPTCMVANTVKGKGVSFMENNPKFHGVAPDRRKNGEGALQELAVMAVKHQIRIEARGGHPRGVRQGAVGTGTRESRMCVRWMRTFPSPR